MLPEKPPVTYTATAPASAPATMAVRMARQAGISFLCLPSDILFKNLRSPGSTMNDKKASNAMWGGRFALGSGGRHGSDQRLDRLRQKALRPGHSRLAGAFAKCWRATGIISAADQEKIAHGLEHDSERDRKRRLRLLDQALEDIHMNVEARLAELIGPAAGRLHTARSRNDQVAVDFRLWVKDEFFRVAEALKGLIAVFLDARRRARRHRDARLHPHAVGAARHLRPPLHGLCRDVRARPVAASATPSSAWTRSPLGAAALAGTGFPIDRHRDRRKRSASASRPAIRWTACRTATSRWNSCRSPPSAATHLSRLAEEIVIWSTPQFGFVKLSDSFSTGSSIMPQKKNPDAAELVRAKTGRVNGHLIGLLTVMKGLPLTYSKDMQEDKEAVFDAAETLDLMLAAMTGMVGDMTVNAERDEARRRRRPFDRHRPRRLAGAHAWPALPRGAPCHRPRRGAGRNDEDDAGETVAGRIEGDPSGASPATSSRCSPCRNRCKSRKSFGGTAPSEVRAAGKVLEEAAGEGGKGR